jgi:hypothetical protein
LAVSRMPGQWSLWRRRWVIRMLTFGKPPQCHSDGLVIGEPSVRW